MEYFKSLKSVLGAPQDDQQPTAAETVCILYKRNSYLTYFAFYIIFVITLILVYIKFLWCF